MGHPIDPDDPVNGGCPLCTAYLPNEFPGTVVLADETSYSGTFVRSWMDPSIFAADMGAPGPPFWVGLNFCFGDTADVGVQIQDEEYFWLPDLHCKFPSGGTDDHGNSVSWGD